MNFKVFENKKLQKEIKELKERQNQIDEEIETKSKKYERGKATKTKRIQNKKLKAKLEHSEDLFHEAAINSAKMELFVQKTPGYIEAEKEDEETYKTKQKEIAEQIEIGSRHKNFKLELPKLGPYRIKYDRTGRYLLMGSKLGHVALLDWYRSSKKCELQAQEAVRDVVFLQNEAMFAVAQKKYTYVYDSNGVEIHCLRNHQDVNRLEYLPYHFLLTSIGNSGYLKYQDVSTGTVVAEIPTKLGPCYAMKQNKHNAIIHLGHSNGTVSLCSPNLHKPVAKIFVNRGRVEDLAIDDTGRYMATSGTDNSIKIWDLRKFHYLYSFKKINSPALSLDISQTNLLAAGFSNKVLIWKDWINEAEKEKMEIVNENSNEISNEIMNEILNENTNQNLNQNLNQNQNQNLNQNQNQNQNLNLNQNQNQNQKNSTFRLIPLYLSHNFNSNTIENLMFSPFEDVLGVGLSNGFQSLIIPGAGEPNIDTYENNPFATRKERAEQTVKNLLEKVPSEMITLDPNFVGNVADSREDITLQKNKINFEANNPTQNYQRPFISQTTRLKRKLKRKQKNVIDEQTLKLQKMIEKRRIANEKRSIQAKERKKKQFQEQDVEKTKTLPALQRFLRKN